MGLDSVASLARATSRTRSQPGVAGRPPFAEPTLNLMTGLTRPLLSVVVGQFLPREQKKGS